MSHGVQKPVTDEALTEEPERFARLIVALEERAKKWDQLSALVEEIVDAKLEGHMDVYHD